MSVDADFEEQRRIYNEMFPDTKETQYAVYRAWFDQGVKAAKSEQPVALPPVDLEAGAVALDKHINRPDSWGSTSYMALAKACAETWGLSWK